MNPYQLIALKARQATKEREAKRKARLLERGSQSSGSGSSGVMGSGESSLGNGSFPRERSEWGRVQPTSTSTSSSLPQVSPSISSSSPSSESQRSQDRNAVQSVRDLTATTITPARPGLVYEQQRFNGPALSPITNETNDHHHDIQMEEEDDDADLKRLMNQAQAMLNISASSPSSGSKSPDNGNDPGLLDVETELDKGKLVGTSVLSDPNDERR
jgi:hypothetical protein